MAAHATPNHYKTPISSLLTPILRNLSHLDTCILRQLLLSYKDVRSDYAERRTKITHLLAQANGPLSATALAAQCGVSRQIIVGDVALLRAGGLAVLATPRGYILENTSAPACAERHIVSHHDNSRMLEELYTVVDLGGAVIDVTVEHAVYGQICAPLHIFSRYDADAFNEKIQQSGSRPLSNLTGGIHLHTIRATDEKTLERVIQGLKDKGFLLLEDN